MQQFLSGDMAELSLIQLTLTEIWARFLKNVILGLHHRRVSRYFPTTLSLSSPSSYPVAINLSYHWSHFLN